jgi:MFS transporter, SP family, general alpha glucoside:H+ symporter
MMTHTNEVEKNLGVGGMSYFDCFRRTDLRRTEICCVVWVAQQLSGSSLSTYAAYFYEQDGFAVDNAFDFSIGMYALAIIGGIIAWFLMPHIGRRTLYFWGLFASLVILIVGGVLGVFPTLKNQPWALGSLIIVLTFVYDMTIGPVCYVVVAEVPSTRLRVKTVVIARVVYNLVNFFTNAITPRMLNPTAWDWKGKACFLYAGTTLLILIWCQFRLFRF